jgi:hypothetical protein
MLLLQAAWILTVPPFRGSDEFDHVYRAAAVAEGQIFVDEWASDGRGLVLDVPRDIVSAAHFQCERLPYTGSANCPSSAGSSELIRASSGAGAYHPAYYWVIGTLAKPFDGAAALYAMRIVSAALCLLFIGLAAWSATRIRSRWPLAGLVLAASPVLVYSTTIVAPNGLEMAAGLALWTALLAMIREPHSRHVRVLAGIAIAAAMVECTLRMLGPLFVALTVLCVVVSNVPVSRQILRERGRLILGGAVPVTLAAAGGAAWVLANGQVNAPPGPRGGGRVDVAQVVVWNLQTIAAFPQRAQAGAPVIYPVILALVGAMVGAAFLRSGRGVRRAIGLATVLTLLLPLALTFASMDGRGVIWQGRYLLPFSVGVVLLSGFALSHGSALRPRLMVIAPAAVGLTVGISACLLKVRREELAAGTEEAWHVPPAILLVALTVLGICTMASGIIERVPTTDPETHEPARAHV